MIIALERCMQGYQWNSTMRVSLKRLAYYQHVAEICDVLCIPTLTQLVLRNIYPQNPRATGMRMILHAGIGNFLNCYLLYAGECWQFYAHVLFTKHVFLHCTCTCNRQGTIYILKSIIVVHDHFFLSLMIRYKSALPVEFSWFLALGLRGPSLPRPEVIASESASLGWTAFHANKLFAMQQVSHTL